MQDGGVVSGTIFSSPRLWFKGEILFHVSTGGGRRIMRWESPEPPRPRILCGAASCPIEGSFDESPRLERLTISARARQRRLDHTIFIFLALLNSPTSRAVMKSETRQDRTPVRCRQRWTVGTVLSAQAKGNANVSRPSFKRAR